MSIGSTADATPRESFDQHQQLSSIAFDPTAQHLALASWDSTVTVLDVATDRPTLELIGHQRGVSGVAYADGYILTTSTDDTARVWDATTGQLLQVDHDVTAPGLPSVGPDGHASAESNNNGQIRIWSVCTDCRAPSALLSSSDSSVLTSLTPLDRETAAQGRLSRIERHHATPTPVVAVVGEDDLLLGHVAEQ